MIHISPRPIIGDSEKLGEDYMFNTKVPFASVPDRRIYIYAPGTWYLYIHLMKC
jgi:hypothetical protein